MKKFLGLTIVVAAAVAAFGVAAGSAAGSCSGPLNESFAKGASNGAPSIISSGTPFSSGSVTVSGITSTSSTAATLVFDDGSGNTLTVNATGTTTGSTHLTFTITGGTISGTGACAGATGSVTGGEIVGQNSNTRWQTDTEGPVTGSFRIAKAGGPAGPAPEVRGPDRYGYCLNGVFENLLLGQPDYDPLYKGATPAFYVDGVGITCDPPSGVFSLAVDLVGPDGQPAPPGYTFPSAIYPHYVHK